MITELARLLGIESSYTDFYGRVHAVPESSLLALIAAMGYSVAGDADAAEVEQHLRRERGALEPVYVVRASAPEPLGVRARDGSAWTLELETGAARSGIVRGQIALMPLESGYHRLIVGSETASVIAAPDAAYLPPALGQRKLWGLAAQLYGLRSRHDWGIGDFGDLGRLLDFAANAGAATLALNPLHELTLTNPASASPYSPASRFHLNALYIDVDAAAAMFEVNLPAGSESGAARALRTTDEVDYAGVAHAKLAALMHLHAAFRKRRRLADRRREFSQFAALGGTRLQRLAVFEALMQHMRAGGAHVYGWQQWPTELHDPASPAVDAFVRSHAADVEFYAFLQWLAETQLAAAAERRGVMPIGIYRDLAVGVDANSAEVWSDRESYCLDVCVGAPPDPMNLLGQNWGFAPFDPVILRARAYAPFIALLRANMRHAGALRIDHVMGLMRLFCIPAGEPSSAGTYVNYRFEEMLGILALESHRNRCMVIGEDLGTVPEGFRARLKAAGIFGCRLMYFEREPDGRFRAPERYDAFAVASTGTHDLVPLAGFWAGRDLDERSRLHFFPDPASEAAAFDERAHARKFLLELLVSRSFMGMDDATRLEHAQKAASDDLVFSLVLAAYQLLGRSEARLLLVQLEDAFLQREAVNTPGTFDEVPNWRRRLRVPVESFAADSRLRRLLDVVDAARRAG